MSIKWEGDLTANLNQMGPKVKRGMVAAANYVAPMAESYMKTNALWTDRTGAARNGLRAETQISTNKVAIIMYHSVPYGVFLEVRWGGKYAIIEKTMAYAAPLFVETMGRMIFDE
jgi:hypothetical protein